MIPFWHGVSLIYGTLIFKLTEENRRFRSLLNDGTAEKIALRKLFETGKARRAERSKPLPSWEVGSQDAT